MQTYVNLSFERPMKHDAIFSERQSMTNIDLENSVQGGFKLVNSVFFVSDQTFMN